MSLFLVIMLPKLILKTLLLWCDSGARSWIMICISTIGRNLPHQHVVETVTRRETVPKGCLLRIERDLAREDWML